MMGVARNALTGGPPCSMAIKTYTCQICKYSTTYLTNYKRHMRRHTGQLFRCDVCGVQYNCRYYLQKHILRNHGSQPPAAPEAGASAGAVGAIENSSHRGGNVPSLVPEAVTIGGTKQSYTSNVEAVGHDSVGVAKLDCGVADFSHSTVPSVSLSTLVGNVDT